jgi:hypothetical protein
MSQQIKTLCQGSGGAEDGIAKSLDNFLYLERYQELVLNDQYFLTTGCLFKSSHARKPLLSPREATSTQQPSSMLRKSESQDCSRENTSSH